MAALALKEKPVVRNPPKTNARQQSPSAMTIKGEIVLVDTADFYADGAKLCAVILWDGSIDLQYAKLANERSYLGKRTGFFGKGDPTVNGSVHLLGCVILGTVIS